MATASTSAETLVLERGTLRVELAPSPLTLTVRRSGRRLVRAGGLWVADGTVHDNFVQFTEGVVAREQLSPPERVLRAVNVTRSGSALDLRLKLDGGREATLRVEIAGEDRVAIAFDAERQPLRLAIDWDRRPEERFVGLGARHGTILDQAGRTVQLGADRRYTGPDCPPEMLAEGASRRGTARPLHGCSPAEALRCGRRPTPMARSSTSPVSA